MCEAYQDSIIVLIKGTWPDRRDFEISMDVSEAKAAVFDRPLDASDALNLEMLGPLGRSLVEDFMSMKGPHRVGIIPNAIGILTSEVFDWQYLLPLIKDVFSNRLRQFGHVEFRIKEEVKNDKGETTFEIRPYASGLALPLLENANLDLGEQGEAVLPNLDQARVDRLRLQYVREYADLLGIAKLPNSKGGL